MTAPRTYTEERFWVAGSLHPTAIAALKAQAKAEGADLGPPWLPSEEGVLYGTVTTTTPPHYRPPRRMPRPAVGSGNWAAFWVALLGFTGIVAGFCWAVRG